MICSKCKNEFPKSRRSVKANSTIVVDDVIRWVPVDSELNYCSKCKIYGIPEEENSKWQSIIPKKPIVEEKTPIVDVGTDKSNA